MIKRSKHETLWLWNSDTIYTYCFCINNKHKKIRYCNAYGNIQNKKLEKFIILVCLFCTLDIKNMMATSIILEKIFFTLHIVFHISFVPFIYPHSVMCLVRIAPKPRIYGALWHKKDSHLRTCVIYWQGWQELNPRLWFWRPSYYHCTTPLCDYCLYMIPQYATWFN